MWTRVRGKSGQMILSEYVLVIFAVIAFVVAIAVYFQRALQARIFDARNYAVSEARRECDKDCLEAAGGGIGREYEPYYGNIISNNDRSTIDLTTIQGGITGKEGIFRKHIDEETTVNAKSWQLPPKDAK